MSPKDTQQDPKQDTKQDTKNSQAKPAVADQAGSGRNQGEGDKDAARRFNESERAFVESGKVDAAAHKAAGQDPAEAAAAEKAGKQKAKEFDPEEARDYSKPGAA